MRLNCTVCGKYISNVSIDSHGNLTDASRKKLIRKLGKDSKILSDTSNNNTINANCKTCRSKKKPSKSNETLTKAAASIVAATASVANGSHEVDACNVPGPAPKPQIASLTITLGMEEHIIKQKHEVDPCNVPGPAPKPQTARSTITLGMEEHIITQKDEVDPCHVPGPAPKPQTSRSAITLGIEEHINKQKDETRKLVEHFFDSDLQSDSFLRHLVYYVRERNIELLLNEKMQEYDRNILNATGLTAAPQEVPLLNDDRGSPDYITKLSERIRAREFLEIERERTRLCLRAEISEILANQMGKILDMHLDLLTQNKDNNEI